MLPLFLFLLYYFPTARNYRRYNYENHVCYSHSFLLCYNLVPQTH